MPLCRNSVLEVFGSGGFRNISEGLFFFLFKNNLLCAWVVGFNEFQKNSLIPFK